MSEQLDIDGGAEFKPESNLKHCAGCGCGIDRDGPAFCGESCEATEDRLYPPQEEPPPAPDLGFSQKDFDLASAKRRAEAWIAHEREGTAPWTKPQAIAQAAQGGRDFLALLARYDALERECAKWKKFLALWKEEEDDWVEERDDLRAKLAEAERRAEEAEADRDALAAALRKMEKSAESIRKAAIGKKPRQTTSEFCDAVLKTIRAALAKHGGRE